MRTAINPDTVFPSKSWVVVAGLLWDRIGLNTNAFMSMFSTQDSEKLGTQFANTVMRNGDPDFVNVLDVGEEGFIPADPKVVAEFSEMMSWFSHPEARRIPTFLSDGREHDGWQGLRERAVNAFSKGIAREQLKGSVDVISVQKDTAEQLPDVCLTELQTLLPVQPDAIDASRLIAFREQNRVRRYEFNKVAGEFINPLLSASSEATLTQASKLFGDKLNEERAKLHAIYRSARVDAVTQATCASFTPPMLVNVLASVLHVGCFMPAAWMSAIAIWGVHYLRTVEKGKVEVNNSPWRYLWSLDKLK